MFQEMHDAHRKILEFGAGSHGFSFPHKRLLFGQKLQNRQETVGEQLKANLCPKCCQKDTKFKRAQLSDLRS